MLSQFMDIDRVFAEVIRVLEPGGVFVFAEEPIRRLATLRLYRCPHPEQMKPWERRLNQWGVLPFLVRDVIGAGQEESFGIRQNHSMYLNDWHALVKKHFSDYRYELFVPERGWIESTVKSVAVKLDPYASVWRAARLLGGTLAAVCRKQGPVDSPSREMPLFETLLRCPDCGGRVIRQADETLQCTACPYTAAREGGVYNLLNSRDRAELYPGDRPDVIDMSMPGHETRLLEGWHELEGVYGNRYRWIGKSASARLTNVRGGKQRLRVRGFLSADRVPASVELRANQEKLGVWTLDRPGLFVIETPLDAASGYDIEIQASPVGSAPGDTRSLSVNLSLIRLLPPADTAQ